MRYEDQDLPLDAHKAVAVEARRRSRFHSDRVTEFLAWAALLLPTLAGVATVWVLFSH